MPLGVHIHFVVAALAIDNIVAAAGRDNLVVAGNEVNIVEWRVEADDVIAAGDIEDRVLEARVPLPASILRAPVSNVSHTESVVQ